MKFCRSYRRFVSDVYDKARIDTYEEEYAYSVNFKEFEEEFLCAKELCILSTDSAFNTTNKR